MDRCPDCGEKTLYSTVEHRFYCKCGWKGEPIKPRKATCWRCGEEYEEYTWFDPSGCNHRGCFASFIE
jgi:ribosomal protein S27AE